jgi:hypothetical protein
LSAVDVDAPLSPGFHSHSKLKRVRFGACWVPCCRGVLLSQI